MKINSTVSRLYSRATINKINDKIEKLGTNSKLDINKVLTLKLILLVLLFCILLFKFNFGYIIAPVCTLIFYFLYDYIALDSKIKKRTKIIEHDAIFFFEVLALTIQNEHNLKLCLEVTTNAIDSELSTEFKEALKEVKLGKSLTEALENLQKRIPSKTVNNVILNIIEANVYGNSIVDSLNNQANYIVDKRILEIKGQINKIPTKISVVSVLLFIPLILLLVLSPVLIEYFIK